MSKEYIVYNDSDNFYYLDSLISQCKEPTSFNSFVKIKKYKIIVEEISEPLETLKERLKELYKAETNWYNKNALNEYCQKLFGVIVQDLDKNFTQEEKIKAIREIIERTEADKAMDLSVFNWKFKAIKFDYVKSENWYSYTAEIYFNCGHSGYYTPSKNSQYILTFKTLAGAKRNFIKKFLIKEK